jgi:hypothetical protein
MDYRPDQTVLMDAAAKLRRLAANAAATADDLDRWAAGDTGLPDTPDMRADTLTEARSLCYQHAGAAAHVVGSMDAAAQLMAHGCDPGTVAWHDLYGMARSVTADVLDGMAATIRDEVADDLRDR